ncbi:extracellular matrix regulator RemB [uncultured Metabacillus sp.]|uniref:extracellular matrix regulator RemB n=1 Tax=Metabacillus sp. Hm71 TaxID=3450743 RepID=UPI00260381C5|nr:extracellular matrix/biofilm biosynthesis regulator RemA family protein [uncultured Metabacillus sp.]
MYIHLGDNFVVPSKEVVMILDRQSSKASTIVAEFLEKQKDKMVQLANGEAKSIIITLDNIYFSPLSSSTLKKRAQIAFDIDH